MAKALTMLVALVIVAAAVAGRGESAQCNAGNLIVCAPAIIGGAKPTKECCSNMKEQQGCFCQYARNPAYARYIKSPNARKTLATCGVTAPRC